MARLPFINPGVTLADELPSADITTKNYCTSQKGIFDSGGPYPTNKVDMDAAMAAYAEVCDHKSLALFFHGGLVNRESGMNDTARKLITPYSTIGGAYPYFFIWESGLVETLVQNLPDIAGDVIFKQTLSIVGSKAGTKLDASMPSLGQGESALFVTSGAQVAPGVPVAFTQDDVDEVQSAVATDPLVAAAQASIADHAEAAPSPASAEVAISGAATVDAGPGRMLSPNIRAAIVAEQHLGRAAAAGPRATLNFISPVSWGTLALGAGKIFVRVMQRFASFAPITYTTRWSRKVFASSTSRTWASSFGKR
jgi:hypothetical protein